MPTTQVNDIELYYQIHGQGEPLILIPGFGVGIWIWFKQIPAFSDRFRTIALDNRGAGQSDKPTGPYTVKMLADDVAGLLDSLGISRAHVLGASLGGFIAQEFALSYPQMTRGLVLCCTSFGGVNHIPPSPEALQAMASLEGLNTEDRARKHFRIAFSQQFVDTHPDEVEKIIQLRLANPIPEHAYLSQIQAAVGFDVEARLPEIDRPTLVMTGDQDSLVPPDNSRNLAVKIPGAKLAIIEGAGHAVFIERAEEYNRAVIAFLESVGEKS